MSLTVVFGGQVVGGWYSVESATRWLQIRRLTHCYPTSFGGTVLSLMTRFTGLRQPQAVSVFEKTCATTQKHKKSRFLEVGKNAKNARSFWYDSMNSASVSERLRITINHTSVHYRLFGHEKLVNHSSIETDNKQQMLKNKHETKAKFWTHF